MAKMITATGWPARAGYPPGAGPSDMASWAVAARWLPALFSALSPLKVEMAVTEMTDPGQAPA
jgi:hypothetical protein